MKKPANFTVFLEEMKLAGYEIKQGNHISFKGQNQKKFIRLCSLGNGYSEDEIKAIIRWKKVLTNRKITHQKPNPRINLLVDIQTKLQGGKGTGASSGLKFST